VITELMRFHLPMKCDNKEVAKCFGLEIARLLFDSSFRDFQIARYESEKRMLKPTIFLKYQEWTPEDDVRPLIFLMSE